MNNVAMNLVATMMQNKFSNSYSTSFKGATQESFTSVLSQSKKTSYEKPMNQRSKMESINKSHDTLGKAIGKINHDQIAKKKENLQKLNRNKNANKIPGNDKPTKVKDMKPIEEELIAELATQFNVDSEEIKKLLNELQLTILDLFDMNSLQLFMAEALGATSSVELIVTDGANEKIQEVMKTLESALSVNPELAKQVSNMTNTQGENVEANESEFAKLIETIRNQSASSNQNQQQGDGEAKTMTESAKATTSSNTETSQSTGGFEGMLNQVVTQKTETIIMNGSIQTIQTEVTAKDVFDQIVTGMKVQVSEAKSNVTLQLQPHNLGKIALNLMSENGSITGHFVAESEAVKEVIEANLSLLKNQLQNQGIEVSEIKISVGSSASFFTGQEEKENTTNQSFKNKNNKRMKIGNINEILADKLSEEMMAEKNETIHENSSIELHA